MNTISRSVLTRAGVAELTGISPETLRFYEREGLLKPPERNATGYRLYGKEDLQQLKFVIRSKGLGFSLRDIREFLQLTGDKLTPRVELRDFASQRLGLIREKIRDLEVMESALADLVAECDGKGRVKGCPIADFLSDGRSPKARGGNLS